MYSSKVAEKNLDLIRASTGLELAPSTPEEVQAVADELEKFFLRDGTPNPDLQLTKAEAEWIQGWITKETYLVQNDARYYLTRYCKITSFDSRLILYPFTPAADIVWDMISEDEDKGVALLYQFLKARQLGISTFWELLIGHRSGFHPFTKAIVASADPEKSRKMFEMVERSWNNLPVWLRPRKSAYSAGEFAEFSQIDSRVAINWGNQKGGIGRGDTPTVAHISEVSEFADAELKIEASLVRAMHENPLTIRVLESTANGTEGWWAETWRENMETFATYGSAAHKPVFLPWFLGTDRYPTTSWLQRNPIPTGWVPNHRTLRHAAMCKEYVQNTPYLTKALGSAWKLPYHQAWFYERERESAQKRRTLNIFLQEMPAEPNEAFQSGGLSIIDGEVIQEHRERLQQPIGIYSLDGVGVAEKCQIPATRMKREVKPIISSFRTKTFSGSWILKPVETTNYPFFDPNNLIVIWEEVAEGAEYALIVDPADGGGKGADNTVIEVIRKGDMYNNPTQVCEFASNLASGYDLWPFILAIASLYTYEKRGRTVRPLVVVETNIGSGVGAQNDIRQRGYTNLFVPTRINKITPSIEQRIGWRTSQLNRPEIILMGKKFLEDMTFYVNSPWLLNEIQGLEKDPKTKKIAAKGGSKDDRVMASFIGLGALYENVLLGTETMAQVEARKRQEGEGEWQGYRETSSGFHFPRQIQRQSLIKKGSGSVGW